jgi:hypothetical protein
VEPSSEAGSLTSTKTERRDEEMKVLQLATWENPKCEEGRKKYYECMDKHRKYWIERQEKYNVKASLWTDGTGKMYNMREFESYEDYAKFMDDEEFQYSAIDFFRTVNNAKVKVLRGSISTRP